MALGWIAGGLGAAVHQQAQHPAIVVRGAANQEVVRGVAPDLSQPLEVRLESAGRRDERLRAHLLGAAVPRHERRGESPVADVQTGHPGVVFDRDAETRGGAIVRVHQILAAAKEEGIGAREMERAAKRWLKAGAVAGHPVAAGGRLADDDARQRFVGPSAGHSGDIVPVFRLGVGVGQSIGGRLVHAAQVPGVPAVSTPEILRCRFEHQHAGARRPGGEGRAEPGVAAADDEHVHVLEHRACH